MTAFWITVTFLHNSSKNTSGGTAGGRTPCSCLGAKFSLYLPCAATLYVTDPLISSAAYIDWFLKLYALCMTIIVFKIVICVPQFLLNILVVS